MTGIQKLSSVILFIIAGLSLVFAGFYYLGGSYMVGQFEAKNYTSLVLIWAVVLFAIAAIATLFFSMIEIFSNAKVLKGFLIVLGLAVVLGVISYFMASSESLGTVISQTIKQPSSGTLKWVGTGLNATYILAVLSFLGIIISEIYRAFQ